MTALESARRPFATVAWRVQDAARRARIVQVLPSLSVGGLENVVVRLVEHLARLAQPAVVTPAGAGPLTEPVPAGLAGRIIEPRRPGALAEALTAYFDDPVLARTHGACRRERAVGKFGLERMLAGYTALYHQYAALEVCP